MRVLILLSFVALAFANQECGGEFEEFNSCGTACPLTCDNYRNPPKFCVLMCVSGCHCKEGYVRTAEGRCINPIQCPIEIETEDRQMCGDNAEYDPCGTACPLTCDNHNNPPMACILPCTRGCHCKAGFVKDSNGNCVLPEKCPALAEQKCGENAHYESCGTACPITCDNHNDPPQGCIMRCESGCQCDKGYVKHSDGRCVRAEQCSERNDEVCAGENEHYESCGTACPLTCDNYANPPKFCVKSCNIGCHCNEGYVRNSAGRCVRPAKCPAQAEQVCGENEHFESCGTACPITCDNHNDPPQGCIMRCETGCQCDKGYVRHSDGRCVRTEECAPRAKEVCGENEKFESCGTACPLTCENYDKPPRVCVAMCKIGCQCEKGYVRRSDGKCVKPETCPARSTQECGENEEFQECGTKCPLTCENHKNPPKFCVLMCDTGCHCKEGFVRHSNGRCVRAVECSPAKAVCGANERYRECADPCPLTCDNYKRPKLICPLMCLFGCECEKGYVRSKDNRCIKPENCTREHQPTAVNKMAGISTDCLLDKIVGPCKARIPRWRFNKTGECEEFIYGGCDGNANNFLTKEKCESVCHFDEAPQNFGGCLEEGQVTGPCRGYFPRWSFNKESGKCEKFIYGGCQGTRNNFGAEEECHNLCGVKSAPTACLEEINPGKCKAYLPRFYYNKETGKCESFIYGGCGGNSNNFMNKQDCHDVCGVVEEAPRNVGDCLEEGQVTGLCRAYIPRWSFNKLSGKCEQFVYGGCGGTKNNFEKEEDCRNLCAAKAAPTACQVEKVVGPCKAAFKRFYFDSATGQCEEFIYGGCGGNSNNFMSKEDCHAVCTE